MNNTSNAIALNTFLQDWGEPLAERVLEIIRPIHNPLSPDSSARFFEEKLNRLPRNRRPFPAQAEVIKALSKAFFVQHKRALLLLGECGIGKTLISIATVSMGKKNPTVLVLCPPQLPDKWCTEIKQTITNAEVIHLTGRNIISTLSNLASQTNKKVNHPRFFVIGREKAKLSYFWKDACNRRKIEDGQRNAVYLHCSECGTKLTDIEKEGEAEFIIPLSVADLRKKRRRCNSVIAQKIFDSKNGEKRLKYRRVPLSYTVREEEGESSEKIYCHAPLWTATAKVRRLSPAEYIKKHLKNFFDFGIFDEVHELAAESSLQGNTFGRLTSACKKSLALTGSPSNGYASSLFHTLYRIEPGRLKNAGFTYGKEQEWSQQYGVVETIIYFDSEDLRTGRGRSQNKIIRRRPGISPLVLANYLLDKSAFMKLADVHEGLPAYSEEVVTLQMDAQQSKSYKDLEQRLKQEINSCGGTPPMRLLSKMLQSLLCYPDSCVINPEEITTHNENGDDVIIYAPKLDSNLTLPKEQALIDIVSKQRAEGRRVLVYCTFTDTRDVTPRVKQKLEEAGFSVAILRSTVKPEKRIQWFQKQVDNHVDVVICNPELVKTGLDLLWFPCFVYYQCGYNLNTLRQSSRRSWRIGQKHPVEIFFFTYRDTLQEQALRLMAKKMETALILEGEIPEEGLTAFSDTEEGSMLEDLAKSLSSGMTGSAEEAWNRFRKKEITTSITVEETLSQDQNETFQPPAEKIPAQLRATVEDDSEIIRLELLYPSKNKKQNEIVEIARNAMGDKLNKKQKEASIQFLLF